MPKVKSKIVIDTECFPNYWLFMAKVVGKDVVYATSTSDEGGLDINKIRKVMRENTTVGFNSLRYDLPMIAIATIGTPAATKAASKSETGALRTTLELKAMSDRLIQEETPSWQICRDADVRVPDSWDHIDLREPAPGVMISLKIYMGRMHSPKMQDLPYAHDAMLTPAEMAEVRLYCENDIRGTEHLYTAIGAQIELRERMGETYGVDLRSKSDAQIAEAVIEHNVDAAGSKVRKVAPSSDVVRYQDPGFINFESVELREIFARILSSDFALNKSGNIDMPDWLKSTVVELDGAKYKMGIGGLHSQEKRQWVEAGENLLADLDVASFYPNIILQQGMVPPGVGEQFLPVYKSIVDTRIAAKRGGDKVVADSLKITINGSFGKLGNRYSFLYAPNLLLQVTLTGQLALLMLIERMSDAGIRCVSANTDGVVLVCPRDREKVMDEVAFEWMLDTSYELERTDYLRLVSRDVNNYVAVKTNGKTKGKGVFAGAGLMKNPDMVIVYESVAAYIASSAPIEETIRSCTDITKFITVRRVTGGAVWREHLLGKAIRFYHSSDVPADVCIAYVKNGNKVSKSDGCRPIMDLPEQFPGDIDFGYYIAEAHKLLDGVGHVRKDD